MLRVFISRGVCFVVIAMRIETKKLCLYLNNVFFNVLSTGMNVVLFESFV